MHRFYRFILTLIAVSTLLNTAAQSLGTPPRLVVNIVVGSMRAIDLDRYSDNFTAAGFNRAYNEGSRFTAAGYNYQGGSTPTSLATIATGALPATHGVTGYAWYDYTTSERVELCQDPKHRDLEYDITEGGHSPHHLIAPTLAETFRSEMSGAQSATIALDATSAVVFNGRGGVALWFDPYSCQWSTSTAYAAEIPEWVKEHNKNAPKKIKKWEATIPGGGYFNTREFGLLNKKGAVDMSTPLTEEQRAEWRNFERYESIAYSPVGNEMILEMAWLAVQTLNMGNNSQATDLLNVYLDPSRNIISRYGPESIEAEDMYYHLDRSLATFIDNVRSWAENRDVIFVLTADHGTSPSFDMVDLSSSDKKVFNKDQFAVILNTFIGSKYGSGRWVLGCENRSIYLNHNLIYQQKLNLEEIQNEVASFALQFRGVSHALTASAMRSSYFGSGYGEKMQNGFYPRRSGDVVINLMPEWIEQQENIRSLPGSMYRYDTHVPLFIWGAGVPFMRVTRQVDISSVAPTIANIVGITPPAATEGSIIEELTNN
ncbi:MAG: alkaline phosphatase family protein [Rikenellaceae bacterium]